MTTRASATSSSSASRAQATISSILAAGASSSSTSSGKKQRQAHPIYSRSNPRAAATAAKNYVSLKDQKAPHPLGSTETAINTTPEKPKTLTGAPKFQRRLGLKRKRYFSRRFRKSKALKFNTKSVAPARHFPRS